METASKSLGSGKDASTRGTTWTEVICPGAKEELVGEGSNVVVVGRVVRSMSTGRLADASLRVEHN